MRVTDRKQAMELAKFRRIAGLSQQKLADKSGVDIAVISRLERGLKREPSYQTVIRLARALHLEPEELVPLHYRRRAKKRRADEATDDEACT